MLSSKFHDFDRLTFSSRRSSFSFSFFFCQKGRVSLKSDQQQAMSKGIAIKSTTGRNQKLTINSFIVITSVRIFLFKATPVPLTEFFSRVA